MIASQKFIKMCKARRKRPTDHFQSHNPSRTRFTNEKMLWRLLGMQIIG